jgi:hypothetical protein
MAGAVSRVIPPEPSREPFVRVVWIIGCMLCASMCFAACAGLARDNHWNPWHAIPFSGMCLFMWLAKLAWED